MRKLLAFIALKFIEQKTDYEIRRASPKRLRAALAENERGMRSTVEAIDTRLGELNFETKANQKHLKTMYNMLTRLNHTRQKLKNALVQQEN